ncbi:hypothetical protein [Kribbella sp.]|uniref:hypothetical protein n=1 Tax=Kribbella sp. TaxID=1871183 RepID=UPI002D6CAC3B|nr:hypothetical protein [Kribbella sp.]HZX05106.1 hypothetical protein [Kribbella sp.]
MQESGSGGTGEQEPEELPEFRDLKVRGRSVRTWSIGAGAVLLVIAAAFGGLKKAGDETPHVSAGTAIDAGQFEVTLEHATVVKDLKPLFTPEPGGVLLAVVTKLKVTDNTGTTPPLDMIRLVGVAGVKDTAGPIGSTNLRDATMNPVLTPDATEDVAFVWELPKGAKIPAEVNLTVQGYQHVDESLLDHHEKWLPDKVVADSTVAVKDKRQ